MDVTRQPDETTRIAVHGHQVVAYSFGSGDEVVLCLNGGPGLPCDYIRDSHSILAEGPNRLVAFNQLGCGASDRPEDDSLWTIERHAEEVEIVRTALNLGKVHLLGQSWGAMLAIEYALTFPDGLKSLILADGAADVPHLVGEIERLRASLGAETVAMMRRHEAEETLDAPEYKAAVDILMARHVCRIDPLPEPLARSIAGANPAPYNTLQGPNEIVVTGNLKHWRRLDDMPRIKQPALVICGAHDLLTPACSRLMHEALPDSRLVVLPDSSHSPFFEEPEAYFGAVRGFLQAVAPVRAMTS